MKQCPSCNRTYNDDALSFCLTDGAPLQSIGNAPDPNATMLSPQAPAPPPPSQDYYNSAQQNQYAPYQPPPSMGWSPTPSAPPARKKSMLPWVIGGVVALLVLGIAGVVMVAMLVNKTNRNSSSSSGSLLDNENRSSSNSSNSSNSSSSSSASYNFNGVRVRVMWDDANTSPATRVGERLKQYGADVIYKKIEGTATKFPNKVFYLPGYKSQAESMASAVSDLQSVSSEEVAPPAVEGAQVYLWVVAGGSSNMNMSNHNTASNSSYNFRGLRIRVMWNNAAAADAVKVADRLRGYGADIVYKKIEDSATKFPGQIFYLPGYSSQAQSVASSVSDLLSVTPSEVAPPAIEGAVLYLWVIK